MTVQNLPSVGDKLYLLHKEVIVTKIYSLFQLVKVRYSEELSEFYVDITSVTKSPDITNSISLRLIRRRDRSEHSTLY